MNDLFLRACRREETERTPIWLMRQAGRYLPEYRRLRERHDFLTLTRESELAAEITYQPVRRFGFDAAILFADIMTPLIGCGVEIAFDPGPVLAKPFREEADLAPLERFAAEEAVPETLEAIRILKPAIDVPLIGFAGAPWTLACYLVDGRGTKDFAMTRALLYRDPGLAQRLLEALADLVAEYAVAQVRAGADAIQLFDTWADLLHPREYATFVLPAVKQVFSILERTGVPTIYYLPGPGVATETGADVVGVDWWMPLGALAEVRDHLAVQGNLDPMALLGPPDLVRERARDVLREAGDGPGHVFNVGRGLHRDTPIESVEVLVETVREESRR
ncbi:MAG: uroporphyrinogen decarboxylase [Planctomycetota bacterium]